LTDITISCIEVNIINTCIYFRNIRLNSTESIEGKFLNLTESESTLLKLSFGNLNKRYNKLSMVLLEIFPEFSVIVNLTRSSMLALFFELISLYRLETLRSSILYKQLNTFTSANRSFPLYLSNLPSCATGERTDRTF